MATPKENSDPIFRAAIRDLEGGSFSRLEPLFCNLSASSRASCQIIEWYDLGYFKNEPTALNEALTCACFNGRTSVAKFLMDRGVDPLAGFGTGMNGFHWAANRGNLETVELLIERKVPMEVENMYGGTVLGCTVWSAVHEPRANQVEIIEALLAAGANVDAAEYPSGNARVDEILRRHGAKASD
jgi:Ankyrin repeats (3 copies)